MHRGKSYKEVEAMVKFIGGRTHVLNHKIVRLTNWFWAEDLPSEEVSQSFIDWLEEYGFEHRGIYKKGDKYAVRYR